MESAIIHTENLIQNLELSDIDSDSHHALMEHYAKLSALQRQCSIKWGQRARLLWIRDGDKNTRFFHSIFCIRAHNNYISQVEDLNGNAFYDLDDIDQAFLNYYQNL